MWFRKAEAAQDARSRLRERLLFHHWVWAKPTILISVAGMLNRIGGGVVDQAQEAEELTGVQALTGITLPGGHGPTPGTRCGCGARLRPLARCTRCW